jgi:hypothetical protein
MCWLRTLGIASLVALGVALAMDVVPGVITPAVAGCTRSC